MRATAAPAALASALVPTAADAARANPVAEWFGASACATPTGGALTVVGERHLAAHEHLYLEGQRQGHVYLLLDGVIGRYKLLADGRRQITSFAYPGDLIGFDLPGVYQDSAEALDAVRVRSVPLGAIDRLLEREPGFAQALLRFAAAELADTREQMVSLGRKSAAEKVAGFLLRLARRSDALGDGARPIRLPMKRSEIADFLGLTIETVSRQLTRLRTTRVIRLVSITEIEVLDELRLETIAEGTGAEPIP